MNIIKPILRKVVQPLVVPVTGLPISGDDSEESWSSYWTQQTRGLLYKTDFDSLSGWTNDGTFSSIAKDALVAFDPLPRVFNRTDLGADTKGVREPQILREGDTLYLFYDGSNGTDGYVTHWATSTDFGKTWVKNGVFGPGYNKGGGGTWVATAMGWVEKRGSTYYFYRVVSNTSFAAPYVGLPAVPYAGDVWSASSLAGTWTYVGSLATYSATWGANEALPGAVLKVGSTFYLFFQAYDAGYNWQFGFSTASAINGVWTINATAVLDTTILADTRLAENPKVFYHPVLQKYVALSNLIAASRLVTDQNAILISSSISDWSSAVLRRFQGNKVIDTDSTIGVSSLYMKADDMVVIGENDFVPFIFDADGIDVTPAVHFKRTCKTALLEPSRYVLRFDGSASGSIYKAQVNTNFVAEFGVQFDAYTAGEKIGFIFRSDGSGDNEYILKVQNGGGKLILIKRVAGVESTVETGMASQTTDLQMINRIRVVVSGTSIKAYIDGQLQINSTDADLDSGTHVGFYGEDGEADIRLFSLRSANTVTLTNLLEGTRVDIMADGKICADTKFADSGGEIVFTLNHFPLEGLLINSTYYVVTDGIWGGDVLNCSPTKKITAVDPDGAPSALTLTLSSKDAIQLDWTNGSTNEDYISIERSTDGVTYTEVDVVKAGVNTWQDQENDIILKNYYYRVRSQKTNRFSSYSNVASNTIQALYIASDLTTITKDGSNYVSRWNDKLGSGHDLIQATKNKKPLWSASGILFDGAGANWDFIKTAAFTLNQPITIYIVGRHVTWKSTGLWFDGAVNASCFIQDWDSSPEIQAYAGTYSGPESNLATNTFGIIRVVFNGANSSLQVNANAAITGNFGTANMGGITLGAIADGSAAQANVEFKEMIVRNVADDVATRAIFYNYLKAKYGL